MSERETDLTLEERETPRDGRVGKIMTRVLVAGIIVVLALGVLYLLSERNSRRYFLVVEDGQWLVQRGIFFPAGERRYSPVDPGFEDAYRPIPLPAGAEIEPRLNFDERAQLDTVLVEQLLVWSRDRIDMDQPERLELGIFYLRRAEMLPTTTATQRHEMEMLRGEVAYHEGRRFIEAALRSLDTARERLLQARASPAGWGRESRQLLRAMREPEAALRRALRTEAEEEEPATSSQDEAESSAATHSKAAESKGVVTPLPSTVIDAEPAQGERPRARGDRPRDAGRSDAASRAREDRRSERRDPPRPDDEQEPVVGDASE